MQVVFLRETVGGMKKCLLTLYHIKTLHVCPGDDDPAIFVRDAGAVAGLKAALVQPLAA